MGGRIYDSHLGRFLQADPFVQAPSNSQSLNRYSYVLNNPLSYTDPSGYFFSKLWKAVKPVIGIIVVAVVSIYCTACSSYFAGSWYGAATAGALAGGINAAANGGNIINGALTGAFSAAAFYGVGSYFGNVEFGSAGYYGKVAAHGLVGGVMNVLQGGKFGHGFAAAGVTQAFAGGIDGIDEGSRFSGERIAAAAVVGGTASKLSGGKFANGAVTGAFSRMFNDEAHHKGQERRERQLEALSKEIHMDAKNRMHQLAKWRTDKNWDAIRTEYSIFSNVSDNNMWLQTAHLQRAFQVIAYEHVGGYLSGNVRDLAHRTIDAGMGLINPNKLSVLQSIYSFISGPPPLPIQHQFYVPRADTVNIEIVRRKP